MLLESFERKSGVFKALLRLWGKEQPSDAELTLQKGLSIPYNAKKEVVLGFEPRLLEGS